MLIWGGDSAPSKKALTFKSNLAKNHQLHARVDAEDRARIKEQQATHQLAVVEIGADGKKRVSGGSALKSSAAYPLGFGCALALVFHEEYSVSYAACSPAWSRVDLVAIIEKLDLELDNGECFSDFDEWDVASAAACEYF